MAEVVWLLNDHVAVACAARRKQEDGQLLFALGLKVMTLTNEAIVGCIGPFASLNDARESFRGAMLVRFMRAPEKPWWSEEALPPEWFSAARFYRLPSKLGVDVGIPLVETFLRAADAGLPIVEALARAWADHRPADVPPASSGGGQTPPVLKRGSTNFGKPGGVGRNGSIVEVVEEKLLGVMRARDRVLMLKARWHGRPTELDAIKRKVAAARQIGGRG
jgi:hypothetical protein